MSITTQVSAERVALSEGISDLVVLAAEQEQWPLADGEPVPLTVRGSAYFVPGGEAPAQQSTIPAEAVLLETTTVTVTGPGDTISPTLTAENSQAGFITWVWEILDSDQASNGVGRFVETVTDFGIPEETQQVLVPGLFSSSLASAVPGSSIHDLAFVYDALPANGALLSFELYRVPMVVTEDGTSVIDYPLNDPAPAEGDELEHSPEHLDWVCTPDNLVFDNLDDPELVTEPGEYPSPEVETDGYAMYIWVESLRSNDDELETIARGECGEPAELTFVLDATTAAASNAPNLGAVEHGFETWDTAEITGYVPVGATIAFEAYLADSEAPLCTADTLAWVSEPVDIAGGISYPEESPLHVTGAAHVFDPAFDTTLYWVEVTYDALGREISRGECGDPLETVGLKGAKAIGTGGVVALGAAAVFFIVATGAYLSSRRRRGAPAA